MEPRKVLFEKFELIIVEMEPYSKNDYIIKNHYLINKDLPYYKFLSNKYTFGEFMDSISNSDDERFGDVVFINYNLF